VSVTQLRRHAADGQFRAGSMGPKVEAAIRFVEATGGRSVIASLDDAAAAVAGRVGTRILRPELPSVGSAAPEPVDRDG